MTEKLNVARLIFIAKTLLEYSEKEAWKMTLRKLILLYTEYKKEHNEYEEKKTIDDAIPF